MKFKQGDFIYNRLFAWKSSFAIIPDEFDGCLVSNEFPLFTCCEGKLLPEFLLSYMLLPENIASVNNLSGGMSSVSRKRFKEKDFLHFEVPQCDIEIQSRICQRLKKMSELSITQDLESAHQISLIKQLRQRILQEAIEGKLTAKWRKTNSELISGDNHASKLLEKIKAEKERLIKEGSIKKDKPLAPVVGAEKPFDLPEGWVWCRLGDWGVTQTGTTPSTFDTTNFGNFIPFIKPADISLKGIDYANEGLSEKGLAAGRLISKNSILMVCIGGSIGKSYFTDRDVSCNQQINCITPLADVDSKLLQQFLQSKYFQDEVWDKAMKSSTPIINKGKWEEIPLPIPPLTEQQALLVRLDKIMVIIDKLERQIAKRKDQSEMLMQSVLREAFAIG